MGRRERERGGEGERRERGGGRELSDSIERWEWEMICKLMFIFANKHITNKQIYILNIDRIFHITKLKLVPRNLTLKVHLREHTEAPLASIY